MKTAYILLVAGILATGSALPARPHPANIVGVRMTISDALVRRILNAASGPLEAQLQIPLSPDFLYGAYLDGEATITYLGKNGNESNYQVVYRDGSTMIGMLDDI